MRELVGPGGYLGAVSLVARNGRIVAGGAYGFRDLARTEALQPDAIFRIYSLTKIVASAAVLALADDGSLALDDRVGRHLPEFSGRGITIRHLLTHTSGIEQATEAVEASASLGAYGLAASRLPQKHAPGTRFEYNSVNTELAGRLVEVASGRPFDVFLRERFFAPLRMIDTSFEVPAGKRHRIAEMTSTDREGRLVAWPAGVSPRAGDSMRPWPSGAGGLYSTAADLARFAQALAQDGALDGVRILSRDAVRKMTTNQLGFLQPPVSQYNEGFGFGGFVNLDVPGRERPGSPGAFGWSGAASTYLMVDPRERLVAILLMQHIAQGLPRDPPKASFAFYNLVYSSLEK